MDVGLLRRPSLDSARDYRQGVEMKSWSARSEQAKLYFERAQIALETVKVTSRRYPLFQRVEGIDPLTHRVSWVWRSKFGVGKKGIIHDFAVVFDVSRCWLSGIEGGCSSVMIVLPVTVVLNVRCETDASC